MDPTPRGKRCVVKVRKLIDVFGLEAKRLDYKKGVGGEKRVSKNLELA